MLINVDSTIHHRPSAEADVLSTERVAQLLGVKPRTVYAYASRGLLTRVPLGPGGGGGYLRTDVERLKARSDARAGHGAVAAGALRWGEPVLDAAVSSIDARGPAYRGQSATELANDGVSFERAAELLWSGVLPESVAAWHPVAVPSSRGSLGPSLRGVPGIARLAVLVANLAAIEARDGPGDRDPARELARARSLIARLAAPRRRAGAPSVASALLTSLGATRRGRDAAQALDRALVLSADHELNASTFASRVAAGAGAGLYACILAAIATLSGTRHGGQCDVVEALLDEIGAPARAARTVRDRLARGEVPPGFGHPLYPAGDPRTQPLLDAARAIAPREVRVVDALAAAVEDATGQKPAVDLALVAVARAIGARRGSATLVFAVGRSAGWTAHILEQRAAGYVLRPRARYVRAPPHR
jgi:citrate synthase